MLTLLGRIFLVIGFAFHNFNNHKFCVRHKDNDEKNNNINNLYISDKKDYLWGENHKKANLDYSQHTTFSVSHFLF